MAPSLFSIGVLALASVGEVSAKQWYVAESYDYTNFFDKFDFFDSNYEKAGTPSSVANWSPEWSELI